MGQQQLLLIILGVIIVGIAVAVGITMFKTNAVSSNRDALVGDMTNYAARAQEFYRRPISQGGGGGVFDNSKGATASFSLNAKEKANPNGTYVLAVSATSVTITGTGIEVSDDGSGLSVQATMIVDPDSIRSTTINH